LLRWPSAFETVQQLAKAVGWRAELSPAGLRARNSAALWPDLARFAEDLRGTTRALLSAFAPAIKSGGYEHGVAAGSIGFVNFQGAMSATKGSQPSTRSLLDRLTTSRVLRRGLLLGCAHCLRVAFYRIGQVGTSFICQACLLENEVTADRWRYPPDEPQWFYDLHPLVRDLLDQHGDVPLLAADVVMSRAPARPSSSAFEIELFEGNEGSPFAEIDFVVIREGELFVGEAKSNSELATSKKSRAVSAERLARAAVGLRADCLVLATSQEIWPEVVEGVVVEAVVKTAQVSGVPAPRIEMLTGVGG
jgi:hypothetical protein